MHKESCTRKLRKFLASNFDARSCKYSGTCTRNLSSEWV